MGIAYWCNTTTRVTYTVWAGAIAAEDWVRHFQAQFSDPDWLACRLWIINQTRVTDISAISPELFNREFHGLCEQQNPLSPNKRLVIIAHESFDSARWVTNHLNRQGFIHAVVLYTHFSACSLLGLDVIETHTILNRLYQQIETAQSRSAILKIPSLPSA